MITCKIEGKIISQIEIEDLNLSKENYYWIICTPDEIKDIKDIFEISEEAIEECCGTVHDTKIEVYSKYNLCTLNEIQVKEHVLYETLNIYYAKNFIIVVSKRPSKTAEKVLKHINEQYESFFLNTSSPCNKILYLMFDTLFMSYFETIIEFDKKVVLFEEEVLKNNISSFLGQFIIIRRQVLRITRYITPLSYMIDIIKLNENSLIDDNMMRYIKNLEIKFSKLDGNIIGLRESVAYLREAYEAQVSNQANNIMKIFTIVSAVFLPLTLLTGVFGMNFRIMPWLLRDYGFYELSIFMIIISVLLILLFRKKKWF